jgi:hypothetical protein
MARQHYGARSFGYLTHLQQRVNESIRIFREACLIDGPHGSLESVEIPPRP